METEPHNTELPNTICRFSRQASGISIYIGTEIAEDVLAILPLRKKLVAVFDKDAETLTIQKLKI